MVQWYKIYIFASLIIFSQAQLCNLYPYNPTDCLDKTDQKCLYSYYENSCQSTQATILGCAQNLNKFACLSQLMKNGSPSLCYFDGRCKDATDDHFRTLGCSDLYSYHACLQQTYYLCSWVDEKCQAHNFQNYDCNRQVQVSPKVCAQLEITNCMNGGMDQNYTCTEIMNLNIVKCTDSGINRIACMRIKTPNQSCVFNQYCQQLTDLSNATCDMFINQHACLSITNPSQTCQWTGEKCVFIGVGLPCISYKLVNQSVCSIVTDACYYNKGNCQVPTTDIKSCSTPGISKTSCFALLNNCRFINNQCQEAKPLNVLRCDSTLNKSSCLNIQTYYQYCQWDEVNKICTGVQITQSTNCDQSNVNGQFCKSILKEPCKYDQTLYKCRSTEPYDTCKTPYLNLLGCVSITLSGNFCQWVDGQCQSNIITKYLTKCSSLAFSNPTSCQLVYHQDPNESNCYYDVNRQGCTSFIGKSNTLTCSTIGLSEIGCSNIRTPGNICRFYRGQCMSITDKAQMQSSPCIEVTSVNPQTCALITFRQERCKYNSDTMSCITSVDIFRDGCETEGLNSFGCAALVGSSCYYDYTNMQCKSIPGAQKQVILENTFCIKSYPTKDVCLSITQASQLCTWIPQKSQCTDMQIVKWNYCADYKMVNPNVCASVLVSDPNKNSNSGYCIFDSVNYRCATTNVACTSPCCENISGINAHVCSRYSTTSRYCYFGTDLRCHEMVLEDYTDTYAGQFINNNQIPCEYLNYKACNLVDWSKSQLCLQVSPDDRCHSVDFSKLTDYSPFFSAQAKVTKFTCSATTQGNIFFKYDYTNFRCQPVTTDQLFSCTTPDININICTRLTLSYCSWDLLTLSCVDAADYLTHSNLICSSILNQNACNDFPNSPCYFDMNVNRCLKLITPDPTKGCSYYQVSNNITTAQLTCALINKLGEACLYNNAINGCVNSSKQSSQCAVVGSNKFYCFSFTTPYCTWNSLNNQCVAVPSNPDPTLTYSCTDGVNKSLCLAIKGMACAWDQINYVCLSIPYTINLACTDVQNPNYLYNKKSCTQITKSGSNCHWDNNQCLETDKYIYQCTTPPMNINSCMSKTRKTKCLFQSGSCINFSGNLNIPCNTAGIGVEICSQIIGSTCMFSASTNTCQNVNINSSTQCNDLMDGNNYNRQSCISINPSVPTNPSYAYNVCGSIFCGYQKYCYWDSTTYTCNVPFIATADSGFVTSTVITTDADGFDVEETVLTPYCNVIFTNFNLCDNSFSQAMCLELIQNSCYFDLNSGGCQLLTGFENVPQTCEKVNYLACSQVTTTGLTCGTVPLVSDGCINPYQSPQVCTTLSITPGTSCSTYEAPTLFVNSLVCSNLSGYCFWNGNQCEQILSGTFCDLAGLSIDACTDLGVCLPGPPCTSGGSSGVPVTCDDITNDGSMTTVQKQFQCLSNFISDGSTTMSSVCAWDSGGQTCFRLGKQYSCDQLVPYLQGSQACIQYTTLNNQGCIWTKNQCQLVSDTVYSCFNLNQYACRVLTSGVSCLWINSSCQQSDSTTIATYTDCTIANKQACQYINSNCWINNSYCVQSQSNSSCSDVARKSGNLKACVAVSQQGQFCFWNTIRNSCDYGPDAGVSCDSLGLNNQSCFRYTAGLCFFNGTCQFASSNNYQCQVSNYNLCITNTQNACYWSSQQTCGQIVYQVSPTCNNFYVLGSQTFNPLACAKIVGLNQTCAYTTYKGRNYCSQITTGDCSVVGINALACLTVTNTQCQFDQSSYVCSQVTDFNQNCDGGFNSLACVQLTAQICYFNNSCKVFDFSTITAGNVVTQTSQYQYNYQVCQSINLPNVYLYYDTNTYKCINYTGAATLRCSQIGLNQQGCIYKTSQNCLFNNGVCRIVYDNFLSLYSCDQFTFNFQTCMNLSQSTCKFVNSQCTPTLISETCSDLTTQIVNQYACVSQQSDACSYNPSTNKCILQTSTTLNCKTTGLNKLGCLSNTTTQRCIYDSVNNICKEGVLSTYKCTDLINIKNCAQVSLAGQYCYFNNTCKEFLNSELLTCVKVYKHNALSCPLATDQPCSYDQINQMCRISTGNEDCASDHTLNQQACSINTGPSKCYWDGTSCIPTTTSNLATILGSKNCTDSVNRNICVAITKTNQFCQFTTICENKQQNSNSNTCAGLTFVNRYEFCEFVTDQPCQYDQASFSCKVLDNTNIIAQCQRGLNRLACLNNVQQQCLFQSFCYSSSQIAVCEQAQSEIQCLGLINLPCMWKDNLCINFDASTTPCTSLNTYKVVSVVCFASLVVPPFVCSYDKTTQLCNQIQPTSCSDINEKQSCKLFSTLPCLWKNNTCQFTILVQGASSCSDVGNIGTERACKDVNKYGQNCKYYSLTGMCDALDTFSSCDDPVNYQSCITQINVQCQWVTSSQIVQTVQYDSGQCKSISDITIIGCSPYLSFLACLSVTKTNQFCYFFDQKCQTIIPANTISLYDYTIINQNVCQLVTTQAAQYDPLLKTCKPLIDFDCLTPGINRIGCISIMDKRCRWQALTYQCTLDIIAQKSSCLDSDVSPLICSQCNGNPVQWVNGSCVSLTTDAKCSEQGINKDACLKITQYPCQWLNNQCQDYIPLLSCDLIPINVNAQVCALSPTGQCKFNGFNSCVATEISDTCDTIGLNQEGCVSISGCAFDRKCFKYENPTKCLQIGVANENVCSQAVDVCKYDPISLKCIQPSITDNCGTQGISIPACENIVNCQYLDKKCQCSLIEQRYPQCDLIQGQIKCDSHSHCFTEFIYYEQGQESFSVSTCRDLKCSDMKQCTGSYLQGLPCYVDKQGKCQQAKSCQNLDSEDCKLKVLDQLCVRDQDKCTDLICENLKTNCPKDFCYQTGGKCYTLECAKINQTICADRSDCYWDGDVCRRQDQCTLLSLQDECSVAKYKGRQCGWIDNYSICTDTPCRFMGKSRGACEGIQTESEICVILSDLSCVSCEEINDPCICLGQDGFCDLQQGTNKCFSKLCSSYEATQCPTHCRVINQKCQPLCNKIYNLNYCLDSYNCVWDQKLQTCGDYVKEVIIEDQILPDYTQHSLILAVVYIILF